MKQTMKRMRWITTSAVVGIATALGAFGFCSIAHTEAVQPSIAQPLYLAEVPAIAWDSSISSLGLNSQSGQTYRFNCVGGGSLNQTVWGSDIYTHDSSICVAAVHAGVINPLYGGTVTLQMLPGQTFYIGSQRNAVTTASYGAWDASFRFVPAESSGSAPPATPRSSRAQTINWESSVASFGLGGQVGQVLSFNCRAGGYLNAPVWGTDIYTDDSSICAAAVHAGLISRQAGGQVSLEVLPGQDYYVGSNRYGVSTSNYGAWGSSFRFLRE